MASFFDIGNLVPSTSSLKGFGSGAFSNYFKPTVFDDIGIDTKSVQWDPNKTKSGMTFMETGYKPTTEFGGASPKEEKSFDLQELGRILQSVQPIQEQGPPLRGSDGGGRGFNFDSKLYKNPMLEREYTNLYNTPLYTSLVK